eukprot:365271-Chlamydomonas_euryale.AAC.8
MDGGDASDTSWMPPTITTWVPFERTSAPPQPPVCVCPFLHLCAEASASVHDECPKLLAARDARDVQPVLVALLHVLLHTGVGHIVVVALLHRPVRVVHSDPLRRRQAQPDLLLRPLIEDLVALAHALLADLGSTLDEDGALGGRAHKGVKQAHERLVLGLLVKLEVDHGLSKLPECRRRVPAQHLTAACHLLLADQVALVVTLSNTNTALEKEQQRVCERLQVIAPASSAPQVRVH